VPAGVQDEAHVVGVRLVFATFVSAGAVPAAAQVKITFDKRPSIEVGNLLTADIRFKSQVDFREFPDEPGTSSKPLVDLNRTRIGVEGRLIRELEYQVEGELGDVSQPWRDAYIQTRSFRLLQLRAGISPLAVIESELGDVSGEVPPHERHSTPTDAMLHLTVRTTGSPLHLGSPP
jgi:hypothetical protein